MRFFKYIVIIVLFSGATIASAQAGRQNGSGVEQKPGVQLPKGALFRPGSGTIIVAQLTKPLSSEKAAIGDQVDAIVTQDLLYQGKTIIPSNARVIGHVTEVKSAGKEEPGARLGVVFEKIVLQGGRDMPFQRQAIIEALAPQMRLAKTASQKITDLPVQMERGQVTGDALMHATGPDTRINGGVNITSTGAISGSARGVIGLKGLALSSPGPNTSVIVSSRGDIKLDYGTQMVLRVTDPVKP